MQWFYMVTAVLLEVCGTLSLRMAATGRRAWYAAVLVFYTASFAMLSMALAAGLGVGVAYGIWAACGVAAIAVASRLLFKEPLSVPMSAGIGLIIAGVLMVEIGAAAH